MVGINRNNINKFGHIRAELGQAPGTESQA